MTGTALGLVLAAAAIHACWNLVAKQVLDGDATFVFLYYTVGAALVTPVAVVTVVIDHEQPSVTWLWAAIVSAALHIGYAVVLQRGYAVGDLSVVYPLARGSGPPITVVVAVALLGERPGLLGLVGALLVVCGVLVIGLSSDATTDQVKRRAGIIFGLLTGAAIAAYTLWDAFSVSTLDLPPLAYFAGSGVLQSALMAPTVLRRGQAGAVWKRYWRHAVAVGVLSPVAYVAVLYALTTAPVALVAPAREFSIVLGGIAAWLVLREPHPVRRLTGAVIVVAGIAAIAAS